jgi:hypothetical protein
MGRICSGWLAEHEMGFHLRNIPCFGGVNSPFGKHFYLRYSIYPSYTLSLPKDLFSDLFSIVARFFFFLIVSNRLGWKRNGELGVEDQKTGAGWMDDGTGNTCLHDNVRVCDEETILYLVLMVRCVDLTPDLNS